MKILGTTPDTQELLGEPLKASPVFSRSVLGVLGRLMISTRLLRTMGT